MNERVEISRGMDTLIVEVLTKIKPTDPLRLAKHAARRKRNWSDSSGIYLTKAAAFYKLFFAVKFQVRIASLWKCSAAAAGDGDGNPPVHPNGCIHIVHHASTLQHSLLRKIKNQPPLVV